MTTVKNKDSALARWQARAVRIVELPSGISVGIRLIDMLDEIAAGSFAQPILGLAKQFATDKLDLDKEMTPEDLREWSDFRRVVIARSIISVDGVSVELTPEEVGTLPGDDIDKLWQYAMRLEALPKSGSNGAKPA